MDFFYIFYWNNFIVSRNKLIMIIYKSTNLINAKIYIGQSMHNNRSYFGSGALIKKAVKKYGKQNFIKEVLQECNTIEELDLRERIWIKYYNSTNREIGYNLQLGGNAKHGCAPETREKLSLINIGKKHTEETKKKIGEHSKGNKYSLGFKHSDETKAKLREVRKTWVMSEEGREKCRAANLGKKKPGVSEYNTRTKKGVKRSGAAIEKMKITNKAKPKLECPHCGKFANPGNYAQNHGNNCKALPENKNKLKRQLTADHLAAISAAQKGKEKSKIECPHCKKNIPGGCFTRYHGDKCKMNPNKNN